MNKNKKNQKNAASEILAEIAVKSQLKEGKEAVRRILREIYKHGTLGTKTLARMIHLPIPTIAAVRKELENVGLIDRVKKGAILTEYGVKFVTRELEISYLNDLLCKTCEGTRLELPHDFDKLITKFKTFSEQRPIPDTSLDQAFGKPITAIRRAYLMLQNDDVEGRNILLLGDDDFTSLALALLNVKTNISVIDIDKRLTETISKISTENGYNIKCFIHDLRKPIPKELLDSFDTILTDPPYTLPGLQLFLSRAVQALKKEEGKKIYLAYPHRAPNELLVVQQEIQNHGLAIQEIIPGFNLYEGAEIHGNITSLIILVTTNKTKSIITKKFEKIFYTGEINPTLRIYSCENKHLIQIGFSEEIRTIEQLKKEGCPVCGSKKSFSKVDTAKIE